MKPERLNQIVAGVLFDFGGYLTTRKKRLIASAADDAAPMADVIREFLVTRGVDISGDPDFDWPALYSRPRRIEITDTQRFDWLAERLEDASVDNADPTDWIDDDIDWPAAWRNAIDLEIERGNR